MPKPSREDVTPPAIQRGDGALRVGSIAGSRTIEAMHLLIPFAYASSDGCAAALPALKLPGLETLLNRLQAGPLDTGDAFSLSPPHERALARALNLPVHDGLIPWAARHRQARGGWGFITPCHWQVGSKLVVMDGAALPDLSEQESRSLVAAMQPYFEEDGIALHYDQPTRWLAHGDILATLATASLDRVSGRDVANWLPAPAQAPALQRLQAEMQMLLYAHPVNDARAARSAATVNAFWLSGTGILPQAAPAPPTDAPLVVTSLRDAALKEDWTAWAQAWTVVDASACATLLAAIDQGGACQLTLCGERGAQDFRTPASGRFRQLISFFGRQPPSALLKTL